MPLENQPIQISSLFCCRFKILVINLKHKQQKLYLNRKNKNFYSKGKLLDRQKMNCTKKAEISCILSKNRKEIPILSHKWNDFALELRIHDPGKADEVKSKLLIYCDNLLKAIRHSRLYNEPKTLESTPRHRHAHPHRQQRNRQGNHTG